MTRATRAAAVACALLTAAACGSPHTGGSPHASQSPTAPPPPAPTTAHATAHATAVPSVPSTLPSVQPARGVTKALVVVLENHSLREASRQMPYLRAVGTRYARATAYRATTHPSLPNYLVIAGGSDFGVHDDSGPGRHRLHGPSVLGQALAHHRSARVYAEAMSRPCQTEPSDPYAVKHNPWAYFADPAERQACQRDDVPAGSPGGGRLRTDTVTGRLPEVGMVVPDLCSDAHDCSLATADAWLARWVPVWTAGPDFRAGRLALVVTFDEDDRSQRNTVLTVVAHPALHGVEVRDPLSHLGLSAWLSRLAGGAPLRDAAGARSLGQALGLG